MTIQVGPAPAYSPGFTSCTPGSRNSYTLLLDPRDPLGYMPGELMSDNQDAPVRPGPIMALRVRPRDLSSRQNTVQL